MPCICHKADVVQDVKSALSREVKKSCSHHEDVASAQKLYSQFCHMNGGKTSFASPKSPPGDSEYRRTHNGGCSDVSSHSVILYHSSPALQIS